MPDAASPPTRKFVLGNWKMNGLSEALEEAAALAQSLQPDDGGASRVGICPPATLIERMARRLEGTRIEVGAQDCHPEPCGAFTGDICTEMLHDAGARLVILGHSERRSAHRESDNLIAAKVEAALRADLEPVICVGESLDEREAGQETAVVCAQLAGSLPDSLRGRPFALAYEPVWAIGTGLTPSLPQIEAMHAEIRQALRQRFGAAGGDAPILYGGSVKPANAGEILHAAEVGGALVGGASLKASDFLPIVQAARSR